MKKIYVVAEPREPFRRLADGTRTNRERAWLILQAFDGLPKQAFIDACKVMESALEIDGRPEAWVDFFTATGKYRPDSGNKNARKEILAEVREET